MESAQGASHPDDTIRQAAVEGRLVAQRCGNCNTVIYYPRCRCPRCFSAELRWDELSGQGRVVAWTKPAGSETALVIVELESGLRVTGSFEHAEPSVVSVGMSVTWAAPTEAQAREGSVLNFVRR